MRTSINQQAAAAIAPYGKYVEQEASTSTQVFEHPAFGNLRVTLDERTSEPWFVARDVAEMLGYAKSRNAVSEHCKYAKILKGPNSGRLTSSPRGISIIPESDVYRLIIRSKLPAAQQFEEWVMEEVLPAIRKHGGYLTPQLTAEALIDPDVIINLATSLKKDRERLAAMRQEVSGLQANLAQVTQEKAALTADLAQAMPKAALVDKVFAPKPDSNEVSRLFKLQEVVRKLAHANTMAIKRDLLRIGYLYRQGGVYRVYAKFRGKFFVEKFDFNYGKNEIYATAEGAALIVKLYREGRLTRKGQKAA